MARHCRQPWAALILAGIAGALGTGCNGSGPATKVSPAEVSPDEQFKKLADDKKARLTELLEGKGSALSHYRANVSEQTDFERRVDYPYVGVIEFNYAIEKPQGGMKMQHVRSVAATYWYNKKGKHWQYVFCGQDKSASDQMPNPLVQFSNVKRVFEE
jgi:hypothetical protein